MGNKKPYASYLAIHAEKMSWWEHMTINSSTYEGLKADNFDIIGSDTLKNEIIELFEVDYLPCYRTIVSCGYHNSLTTTIL